jgi:hypothetical protein
MDNDLERAKNIKLVLLNNYQNSRSTSIKVSYSTFEWPKPINLNIHRFLDEV